MNESRGLKRRTFLKAGSLSLLTAATLSACSTNATPAVAKKTTSSKTTHLSLMGVFFLPAELAAARSVINAFNEQSKNVKVNYVQSSWGALSTKMTVSFSTGDVPDLFQYYDAGLVPWGENGLLTDLRKVLPSSMFSAINPGAMTSITVPSHGVLGLPFETETPLIYYNVDMLKAAGIAPATINNPWTWEELFKHAAKLAQPENKIAGLSANWSSSELLFKNGLGWQANAKPIVHKGGNYSITASDHGTKAAVEYAKSFFAAGYANMTDLQSANLEAEFLSGKSALFLRGAWERTNFPTIKGTHVKWAAMPMVKGAVKNLGSGAAQTLSIPESSKNKEAAAEFLQWWGKPGNVAKINRAAGQIPPNLEAVDMLKKSVGSTDYWPAALAEVPDLKGQPFCPGWFPMLGKVWDPAMFSYFQGKSTFDQFASTVASQGTKAVQTAAGEN